MMVLSCAARWWAGNGVQLLVAVGSDADDGFTRSGFGVHGLLPLRGLTRRRRGRSVNLSW
ncbi:hypothetical protein ACIRRA_38630 [Nocardia sp. NPDC101769]|uniref:hypothetical protein n=1 Tax=Nocardia sp. NPDC101769 TaxID=3364333 RepID=UPI0037FB2713